MQEDNIFNLPPPPPKNTVSYNSIRRVCWACLLIILILSCYIGWVEYNRYTRMEMFPAKEPFSYENGYYSSEGFYCVWTQGRSWADVAKTDVHEQCHVLIHQDQEEHFCNEEWTND